MIAEDDEATRKVVGIFLKDKAFRVLEAIDGAEALNIAENFGQPIHLLVTDVTMPRMNGLELAGALPRLHPETKIVYMTADPGRVAHTECPVIEKPFTLGALLEKIREQFPNPS